MTASKRVSLYNFDHGFDAPGKFQFGPFEIKVNKVDAIAAAKLSRHGVTRFTYDQLGNRIVVRSPAKPGEVLQTATARLTNPASNSAVLLDGLSNGDSFCDLATILSFLTGRRVFLKSELSGFESLRYGESVVALNYFRGPGLRWPDLAAVHREGLVPALWALISASSTSDLIGKMCYASAALDSITTRWFKDAGQSHTQEDASRYKQAQKNLQALAKAELDESPIKDDVVARLPGLFSPSAITKLRAFLVAQGFMQVQSDKDELDRMKLMNSTRNRVVHSADIPSDLDEDPERRVEIAAAVLAMTVEIGSIYIANVAGIRDFQVEHSVKEIAEFFRSGTFRKHKVFDESYETFSARMEEGWVDRSEI